MGVLKFISCCIFVGFGSSECFYGYLKKHAPIFSSHASNEYVAQQSTVEGGLWFGHSTRRLAVRKRKTDGLVARIFPIDSIGEIKPRDFVQFFLFWFSCGDRFCMY